MLSIESISKSYGEQVLLENTGFQINPGERVGLVGRNGHGKTTLLRMITGLEEPDTGTIRIPGDYRLGYLTQTISFSKPSVLEECMLGLAANEKDHSWKAEKILAGLGFSFDDMKRAPEEFSGGYQVRLTLAKVLVSEPDLLILDEPTNYLDITSIRWISGFLSSWPREVLIVTHDRSFMDSVVTHIAGIHREVIRKIQGTTQKYYVHIAQDEDVYEKTRLNQEKRRKEMETFITRFRAKARLGGLVQSRVKSLEKMEKKEKLQQIETLDFYFRYLPYAGKQLLRAENLSFSYDKSVSLIHEFNLVLGSRDRVAIVGKNGKGKTTLLKLLAGMLEPGTGHVTCNPGVETGYFEQTNIQSLNENNSVEEELVYSHKDMDRQKARNICGAMMFEGDNALKRIKVLSGGEKSRVMLGKLLAKPLNILLLDEPTNHLDMETCDSLVDALASFEGGLVLVTHNELFLHTLANRLVVFKDNRVFLFEGTYQEFLEKEGWDETTATSGISSAIETVGSEAVQLTDTSEKKITKKDLRKLRSEIVSERSQALRPLQKKIDAVERAIETAEALLSDLTSQMQDAAEAGDGIAISAISCRLGKCQNEIDTGFDRLEQLTEELDDKAGIFEKKLNQLEK